MKSWRGGNYVYPPNWTRFEKISKEDAEYKRGMPFENCGKCMHYQSGECEVVRGTIVPSMVCKYFSEKY